MNLRPTLPLSLLLLLAACSSPGTSRPPGPPEVRAWGAMREVLRDGHDEGRVEVPTVCGPQTVGVGALAGLRGEVTIVDGRAHIATARAPDAEPSFRAARAGDQATLLLRADVAAWAPHALDDCGSYEALDAALAELVRAQGFDPEAPTPVRIEGRAARVAMHVIAGACPIANPSGPSPWRFEAPAERLVLVGFYVEGAAGRFTHHTHQSHLHAVVGERSGHLDDVALAGATAYLPRR